MTTWTNNVKVHEADECSHCEDTRATFVLTDELFGVIQKLCADIKGEWQALLIGEERENNVVYAHDYYIPKQTVTSASVTNNECFDVERIKAMGIVIGIHSHGTMGAYFSTTDHDCTNTSPIKNNIVVNNKQEFVGTKALTLPCGMIKFLDADVVRDMPEITPVEEIKDVKNIEEKTYTYGTNLLHFGNTGVFDNSAYVQGALGGKRKKHSFNFEKGGW
jgi:hypothetical protein